ncbi:hypothetical protein FHS15_004065 [Paenibacillus castaneae]|uniref:DUF4362 domain-containing protein n=1 Tax=Paenibacillus castaneae TaxID=474957 RepID=UPI00141AFF8B|nr:DUF4362 domain-containing protein [Paenibacillus castaneae]NIK78919.1 hypothetical protein [Paenibacillus castaneae]
MNLKKAIMVCFSFLLLLGCQNVFHKAKNLEGRPYNYSIQEEADVVARQSRISNVEKLDAFMKKTEGVQRVIHYTDEGDPIYLDLMYTDGGGMLLRYDTTKDKFGSPSVNNYSCEGLEIEESDQALSYKLKGCKGDQKEFHVLYIPYDVEAQDKFEFILKYGAHQKNEINTVEKKLIKDLVQDGLSEINHFELTKEDRALIYKKMVLANYLSEKKFANNCNQEPSGPYALMVQINGATVHYEWEPCDDSKDGIAMTKLVKEIITIVQETDEYKSLPPANGGYL